jgi:hypothetical protein
MAASLDQGTFSETDAVPMVRKPSCNMMASLTCGGVVGVA